LIWELVAQPGGIRSDSSGVYVVHQLVPELFGGFEGTDRSGFLARPEKALFDIVYVRAAAGSRAYLPELSLPPGFDRGELSHWSTPWSSGACVSCFARRFDCRQMAAAIRGISPS
jgi:hypothetical protein